MKKILGLVVILLVAGCKDDDLVATRTVFKFSVTNTQDSGDRWIIVRDNDTGELIDSKKIDVITPLVIESTKKISSGKLAVTYLTNPSQGAGFARVYTGIDVGSEWTWSDEPRNKSNPSTGSFIGTYSLKITGVPSVYSLTITDRESPTNRNIKPTFENGTITSNPGVRSTTSKQLVTIDTGVGNEKYAYIENPKDGDNITLDYSSFLEFDKYTTVTFPQSNDVYAYVGGYEGAATYYNTYNVYDNVQWGYRQTDKSGLNIGLFNNFQNYRFNLTIDNFEYAFLGAAPSTINWQSNDGFTVENNTVGEYKLNASKDYTYSISRYTSANGSNYNIDYYAPAGDGKFHPALTEEIASMYSIAATDLHYYNTQVILGTQTYTQYLNSIFGVDFDPAAPYEIRTLNLKF